MLLGFSAKSNPFEELWPDREPNRATEIKREEVRRWKIGKSRNSRGHIFLAVQTVCVGNSTVFAATRRAIRRRESEMEKKEWLFKYANDIAPDEKPVLDVAATLEADLAAAKAEVKLLKELIYAKFEDIKADGKTILDFYAVWHRQDSDALAKAKAELERLKEDFDLKAKSYDANVKG
jgi:hypothetical protein